MGGRKEGYKDLNKWKRYKCRQKKQNYAKGRVDCNRHKWTEEEDLLLFDCNLTDRQLSKILHHSVQAIQVRRCKIRKGMIKN